MDASKFSIGIDLGTSNCALAYCAVTSGSVSAPQILPIPQTHVSGQLERLPTLPSLLYWLDEPGRRGWQAGLMARQMAAQQPDRIIGSAKSWMGHHAVDRQSCFLPFGVNASRQLEPLSPIQVQAHLLRFLADAWNVQFPNHPIQQQQVVVTVPASFDPIAQQLTLEAIRLAGLPDSTTLLEEPQAAFLAWLANHRNSALDLLKQLSKAHVLVVDIGGGTTDFSLFACSAKSTSDSPDLQRIAVSDHILLGGDNMDLALAHAAEDAAGLSGDLNAMEMAALIANVRDLKEQFLLQPSCDTPLVGAIARRGKSLLASTSAFSLPASSVRKLLLEGFLPETRATERPLSSPAGLREMGLPYAKDPAFTRHLAAFLAPLPPVDLVLFNGGVTRAKGIRERLLANIQSWQPNHPVAAIANDDPDLAVALGAAWHSGQLGSPQNPWRVTSGSAHSYYLALADGQALCVLPQGTEQGLWLRPEIQQLQAKLNRPVSFALARCAEPDPAAPGTLIPLSDPKLRWLPALYTHLSVDKHPAPSTQKHPSASVAVWIESRLGNTGLLELRLIPQHPNADMPSHWPLHFEVRSGVVDPSSNPATQDSSPTSASVLHFSPASFFSPQSKSGKLHPTRKFTANSVLQDLEKRTRLTRHQWPGLWLRQWCDELLLSAPERLHSHAHEAAWWQLCGWFLRPGCGMPGDEQRVQSVLGLLTQPLIKGSNASHIQALIAARRIAPGLDAKAASQLWQHLHSEPAASAQWNPELALLAAALEHLSLAVRAQIADTLTQLLQQDPHQGAYWRALGQLLARHLFHGGASQVLPPDSVELCWSILGDLIPPDTVRTEATHLWLKATRLTGLRPLDVSKSLRKSVEKLLKRWQVPPQRLRVLHEIIPLAPQEQNALLGDSPPPGLTA
ncbi:MAG: Hsp70 family protein [Verrucomicrobia bacterium]|nr:Hsp70 family protein [Verrucomicrobiota bacterium]